MKETVGTTTKLNSQSMKFFYNWRTSLVTRPLWSRLDPQGSSINLHRHVDSSIRGVPRHPYCSSCCLGRHRPWLWPFCRSAYRQPQRGQRYRRRWRYRLLRSYPTDWSQLIQSASSQKLCFSDRWSFCSVAQRGILKLKSVMKVLFRLAYLFSFPRECCTWAWPGR